jgi:hypothetical protein
VETGDPQLVPRLAALVEERAQLLHCPRVHLGCLRGLRLTWAANANNTAELNGTITWFG